MATLFTRIVKGEIPCHKIAENEKCLAFLDIHPIRLGHTLVIPKQEINYIFDVDDQLLAELMVFAKKIALALGQAVPCKRVGVMVAGLEVPHAHIHLIPMQAISDLNFALAKPADNDALAEVAAKIRSHLSI
jgi:histidine triad (HIT) family protein